jgi:hypothetical protein
MNPRPGLAVFIKFIGLSQPQRRSLHRPAMQMQIGGRDEWVRCIYIVPGIRSLAPAQPSAEPYFRALNGSQGDAKASVVIWPPKLYFALQE